MIIETSDCDLFKSIADQNKIRHSFIEQAIHRVDELKKDFFRVIKFKDHTFLLTLSGDGIVTDLDVVVTAITYNYDQIQINEKSDPRLLIAYGELLTYLEAGNVPEKNVEETDRCIKVLSNRHLDIEEVAHDKN